MSTASMNIPFLSEQALEALNLSVDEIIKSIEKLILGAEKNTVWSAPKAVIMPPDGRYMMAALAAMDGPSHLAVKTVVLNPENPDRGLPQINGLVTMLDSSSGLPVAILDGNWITAVRTAGLSATAAKHLANKDASSIGFVGCGVQARSHLETFMKMFPIKSAKYFGRGKPNIEKLEVLCSELGVSVEVAESGQEAIENVDIVVTSITATGGPEPFLDAQGLKTGAFAAITDLGVPWIKDSFQHVDHVVIDDVAQEMSLPNKLCNPDHISGDISDLVTGKLSVGDTQSSKNVFLFRGHALGDLALSSLALTRFQNQ